MWLLEDFDSFSDDDDKDGPKNANDHGTSDTATRRVVPTTIRENQEKRGEGEQDRTCPRRPVSQGGRERKRLLIMRGLRNDGYQIETGWKVTPKRDCVFVRCLR